jgi:4-hydroxyphenylpyruvate dioxygenase-like putative hemolysin
MTETSPLHPLRYLHTIHAAAECERLRHIYTGVFGGIVFSENYFPPEDRDAALLYVADHMIEVMAPRHTGDLRFMFARYLQKAGPSYHSISFRVTDCNAAHERCKDLGILINTVGPGLIYLHPKSTGGIVMELTDHQMPNDPYDLPGWRSNWALGRPNRPHAIDHIVCAPRAPAAAIAFFVDRLDGTARAPFAVTWPQRATATPVDVADISLLILDPTDHAAGPLVDFASGPNGGVYALAWKVADPTAAAQWFGKNGIPAERLANSRLYTHEAIIDGARHWFVGSTD